MRFTKPCMGVEMNPEITRFDELLQRLEQEEKQARILGLWTKVKDFSDTRRYLAAAYNIVKRLETSPACNLSISEIEMVLLWRNA